MKEKNTVDAVSTNNSSDRQISEAKLIANKQNAQNAKGATSEAGRRASSMNALRHGMCAMKALLPSESAQAYEELVESHVERHAPANDEERELVQMIADNAWRILRVAREEVGIVEVCRNESGETMLMEEKDPVRRTYLMETGLSIVMEKRLHNLRLHERRIRKQHKEDLAKLKEMQTERIEKPKCEAKQAIEENEAFVKRAGQIFNKCERYNIPFNPADFGFVFSIPEWKQYNKVSTPHYMVSGETLNFNKFLAEHRAAQMEEKAA